MKKNLFICLIVSSVLISQIAVAQKNKDKEGKGKTDKVEPAVNIQNKGNDKPVVNTQDTGKVKPAVNIQNSVNNKPNVVVSQDTTKPIGKPQISNDNAVSNRPSNGTSAKPVTGGELDINAITNNSKPLVTQSANGSVNWTEQYIEAKGESAIDTVKFKNLAQAKAMAARGAVVVAQRNLLEIIKGVNVTSETTVKDMITQGDYIYTRVDGVIKGAQMVGEAIEKNGMMEVKMRVPIYNRNGLASALYNDIPPQTKSADLSPVASEIMAPEVQNQDLSGLAFNLNGKTFDPSMFPVVVDENGKLVFDFSKIYDPAKGDFPKIFGATETLFNEFGFKKGVEYLNILRTEPGKIVLDNKNIKKVNWGKIAKTAGAIGKFIMMFI